MEFEVQSALIIWTVRSTQAIRRRTQSHDLVRYRKYSRNILNDKELFVSSNVNVDVRPLYSPVGTPTP